MAIPPNKSLTLLNPTLFSEEEELLLNSKASNKNRRNLSSTRVMTQLSELLDTQNLLKRTGPRVDEFANGIFSSLNSLDDLTQSRERKREIQRNKS